jgi:hypothetical protein
LLLFPSLARADGGALRLAQEKDGYRIAVFTAPTPLRAGPVDFSVLVQDAATGELASGVQATVKTQRQGAKHEDPHSSCILHPSSLYYAATLDLPEPGWYSVEVSIRRALAETQVHFDVDAAEPLPQGLTILPWVGWPLVVISLFLFHQLLVRSRNS